MNQNSTHEQCCNKKTIAIIPARAGSKRIIGKNTKLLAGKPLIAWTIDRALEGEFAHVVVSTDCNEIAKIATDFGAEIPFLRSSGLAQDSSNVIDAIIEMLQFYQSQGEHFDAVLLLQPTSPFRSTNTMNKALDLFKSSDGESVVSVCQATQHPGWFKTIEDGVLHPFLSEGHNESSKQSQQLSQAHCLNGVIYLATPKTILNSRSFYSNNTKALVIESEEECIDIDTTFDWLVAEAVAKKREDKQ